jgi:DNA adenine methylase
MVPIDDRRAGRRADGPTLSSTRMPVAARTAARSLGPPLKWAGGKRWQVPRLVSLWRPHRGRRLVEPFCGGLAVALGLSPHRALLNDVNPHLINFYRWLQRGLVADVEMVNDASVYNRQRRRFNALLENGGSTSAEAAALFYFLNRTGYNGLCRFNKQGEFNVPFGRYRNIRYTRDFTPYAARLTNWEFAQGDFAGLPIEPDDFIYADPPYDVEFTAYSRGGFSWDDQRRVAILLADHPGPVVLVNQSTERIEDLYRSLGYAVRHLDAPRRISCNGDRRPAREVLAVRHLDVRG